MFLLNLHNKLQENITEKIFGAITYSQEPIINTLDNFKQDISQEYSKESFSALYNKFYDSKNPLKFVINGNEGQNHFNFDEL